MTFDNLLALAIFGFITAYTPGPNNTLMMAAGMNHGMRRSLPMILGVGLGFPLMIGCVGLGLGRIFEIYPVLYSLLKYAGGAYMLWLAWKIATAVRSDAEGTTTGKPLGFLQMAAFQWINPKGWIMAVTALSAYTVASHYYVGVAAVVTTFVIMGLSSAACWAAFGASLRHLMNNPRWFRWINLALAALLVASLVPMLRH